MAKVEGPFQMDVNIIKILSLLKALIWNLFNWVCEPNLIDRNHLSVLWERWVVSIYEMITKYS